MEERFSRLLDLLFPGAVSDGQKKLLEAICERTKEVNEKINITSVKTDAGIYTKHIADSVSLSFLPEMRELPSPSVCDVGCGGGFPGLPVKAMLPNIRLAMLDSTEKKLRAVEETSKLLGFSGMTFYPARAEEIGRENGKRESFDIVFSRAVAPLNVLSELCLPLVKQGGYFLAMKSQKAHGELDAAAHAVKELGGSLVRVSDVSFSPSLIENELLSEFSVDEKNAIEDFISSKRYVIVIKKTRRTQPAYPRSYGAISKRPL